MADEKKRGGQKAGAEKQPQGKGHQGVAAPADKKQPGHAAEEKARQEFLKETK